MEKGKIAQKARWRRRIQSVTWILVPIVMIGGFWYPLLGFFVLAVMLMGIVGGFLRGRFVCGWLCPRGAFYDRVVKHVSPRRTIPKWLRDYRFRWAVFALLMGFLAVQVAQHPGDIRHWGAVFVRMCLVTTAIGIILALIFHPRTWCSFCPMGTVQGALGGRKKQLMMKAGCQECRTCEKSCPIALPIVDGTKEGVLQSRDCLKCPECQLACPKNILDLSSKRP